MPGIRFIIAVVAALVPLAFTQDGTIPPPVTMRQNIARTSQTAAATVPQTTHANILPFCPPRTCLYYAGDQDSNSFNANSLFNLDDQNQNIVGQVWMGVKPNRNVIVTGATFNEFLRGDLGVNPTPFAVQVGIKPGQAGKTICSTSGNATIKAYQRVLDNIIYSYRIKNLSQPCKLKKGTVYYVNLVPTYADNLYGYVVDVEDAKPANHKGWKNITDSSYFNGAFFGADYQPTWGSSGACDGVGCDLFSVALTGK